jgi:hypothetical protein
MAPAEQISAKIVTLRGQRVILDADLALLYGVETRGLLQAVRRNADRFPPDFMFLLSHQDVATLRSQFVISKRIGRGGRSYAPYAFTEHGAIMAATVLNSARAIEMAVYVVRAFVRVREMLAAHRDLSKRLDELEARLEKKIGAHDRAIGEVLDAIRRLMTPPEAPRKRGIGFVRDD